jgi:hypothetical protein
LEDYVGLVNLRPDRTRRGKQMIMGWKGWGE